MKKFNYIYLITNKINGKIYVGKHSTNNLDDGYMGSGVVIKKAINKYGIENFTKDYLAFCDTENKLNWFEKFYIKKYKARETGYNLTDGGDGVLGWHHSEETKEKLRKPLSESTKQKLRDFNIGLHHSEETKIKMHNSHIGKTFSEEHKQHISNVRKGKASEPHRSERTKFKISNNMKGVSKSESHKQHMRKPKNRYKWLTPSGEIREMSSNLARRYHPDWKKIEESF